MTAKPTAVDFFETMCRDVAQVPGHACFAAEHAISGKRRSAWFTPAEIRSCLPSLIAEANARQCHLFYTPATFGLPLLRADWEAEEKHRQAGSARQFDPLFVRGRKVATVALPALYADADISDGPYPKDCKYPTRAELLEVIYDIREPSAIVCSGSGLHPYWFLDPIALTPDAKARDAVEAKAVAFQALIRERLRAQFGRTLDSTANLARVLRVPGSINHKYGAEVTIEFLAR